MRPLLLDVDGFGPFSRACRVDFRDADFFALIGPTGAGKSTVLDAMCFALYGKAPRWGSGIEHSLAPSAGSGSVRLTFRADGDVYVATRVVKRGAGGKVTTSAAALERLPETTSTQDLADVSGLIGVSLAASAKAVTAHVERIVGLPFEQFTKCVLLPQGAFAEFLHASPAERRKILESLLGYTVYRDVQTAAGEEQRGAEAAAAVLRQQLEQLPTIDSSEVGAAEERVEQLRLLAELVDSKRPEADALARDAQSATQRLRQLDADQEALGLVEPPADATAPAAQRAQAENAVADARAAVTAAESAEDRLRAQAAEVDVAGVERMLAAYAKAAEVADSIAKGAGLTESAEADHARAEAAVAAASADVTTAEAALDEAKTADVAATLQEHLHVGEPCPVCRQTVDSAPQRQPHERLEKARLHVAEARQRHEKTQQQLATTERTALSYRARLETLTEEQARWQTELADAPPQSQLQADREAADVRTRQLADAAQQVRAARGSLQHAETALADADRQLAEHWREFDRCRDQVAALGPPAADRDDLAASWSLLTQWAKSTYDSGREARAQQAATVDRLAAAADDLRAELAAACAAAGVHLADDADPSAAVASARLEAGNRKQQLEEQLRRGTQLREQHAEKTREGAVARELKQQLGPNYFVGWLLSEAMHELTAEASRILMQLSSGQYELIYSNDKDLYVVDHHDADLTRPVRTLSGGETFAASLALALAMSQQLANMSAHGACLESILIDEGFGTLDAETLDQVAAVLESLAAESTRMVGVVTHVPALAERIPVRFSVGKNAVGSHVQRMED